MNLSEALGRLLVVALAFIGAGWLLGQVGYANWGSITSIGGVLLFAFIAIVVGILSKSLALSVGSASGITGLLMAYVYVPFAVLMVVIFAFDVIIHIALAYNDSQSNGGFPL